MAEKPQNFEVLDGEQRFGPYDLVSVMHYPWTHPAVPAMGGKPAIPEEHHSLAKIPQIGPVVYPSPTAPSAGDAAGVGFMYGIVPDRTPIAALRRHDEHMELWVVAADGTVRGTWFHDGRWGTWYQLLGRTFPAQGHLAAIHRHEDPYAVAGPRLGMLGWFPSG
jgi:hypothetical protein